MTSGNSLATSVRSLARIMRLLSDISKCCQALAKLSFYFFNSIFAVLGFVVIIWGFYAWCNLEIYRAIAQNDIVSVSLGMTVAVGVIILLLAAFGCYGMVTRRSVIILLYALSLMVLTVVELSLAITALIYWKERNTALQDKLHLLQKDYKTSSFSKYIWDNLQFQWTCCGVTSKEDWSSYLETPPRSCMDSNSETYYTHGCFTEIQGTLISALSLVVAAGFVSAGLQFLEIVAACFVAVSFRNPNKASEDEDEETENSKKRYNCCIQCCILVHCCSDENSQ